MVGKASVAVFGEISTVDDAELPVQLPDLQDYKPGDGGQSPLANATEWLNVVDKNGRKGFRETNTMPQWAGSCWYYLRYIDACNGDAFVAKELEKYWMPVDLYVGGAEHAVLHLLYSRFWHKVLFDLGLVSTDEPFQKLFNQGMILAYAYEDAAGYTDRSAKPHSRHRLSLTHEAMWLTASAAPGAPWWATTMPLRSLWMKPLRKPSKR